MRTSPYLSCIAVVLLAGAASAAPPLPLFTAFETFCVDTGAKPDAVGAAVRAAGGRPHDPPGGSTDGTLGDAPFPMTFASFDVSVGGHAMVVNAGTAWPSRKYRNVKNRPGDFDSCAINSAANDDDSVRAIQAWVGVPPDHVDTTLGDHPPDRRFAPGLSLYYYSYRQQDGRRSAIATDAAMGAAMAEGGAWHLVLMRDPQSASLQLTHNLPALP